MPLALLASALVVFGAPYAGEIRGALQSNFPDQYRLIIGVLAGAGVAVAAVSAAAHLWRSRGRAVVSDAPSAWPAWLRGSLVVLALIAAVASGRAASRGNPDVDLVEAFHFVEYGFVAYLFYRPSRRRGDVGAVARPACAALLVGVADEWMQWRVPGRVGELHDVWLNAAAIGCGLMVSAAVHPPGPLPFPSSRRGRAQLAAAAGVLIAAVAGFVDRAHLGHEIGDPRTGTFRSQYEAGALTAAAGTRGALWRASPPPQRGFAREDHYLSEGLWHVQQRNRAVSGGDERTAWHENLILERYFAPVLDRGSRLTQDERAGLERAAVGAPDLDFVSSAQPYPIYVVSRRTFWGATLLLAAVVIWGGWRVHLRVRAS